MNTETKGHTCQHCGYTGTNVAKRIGYIGGLGHVEGYYCLDTDACWKRWESREKEKLQINRIHCCRCRSDLQFVLSSATGRLNHCPYCASCDIQFGTDEQQKGVKMDKEAQEKIDKYWCEHSLMQIPWDNVKGEMREIILEHAQELLNELRKLGYRKLPDKPPPLLSEEPEKEEKQEKEEEKPFESSKEAVYRKPPDRDDNPPPPMPRSDQEPDEADIKHYTE